MKKLISLAVIISLASICFSACHLFKHEHIPGKWEYDEAKHWRSIDCTWDKCDIYPSIESHVDQNNDGICDVCNYIELE